MLATESIQCRPILSLYNCVTVAVLYRSSQYLYSAQRSHIMHIEQCSSARDTASEKTTPRATKRPEKRTLSL